MANVQPMEYEIKINNDKVVKQIRRIEKQLSKINPITIEIEVIHKKKKWFQFWK